MDGTQHDLTGARAQPQNPRAPLWARPILRRLGGLWRQGRLLLVLPDGAVWRIGDEAAAHQVVWIIRRWRALGRMMASGDIGFAEGYVAGDWDSPDLMALLVAFADNYDALGHLVGGAAVMKGLYALSHTMARNSRKGAKRNIIAHYDLGNAFYEAWLDPGMTYSAALFEPPTLSLEQAQTAKYAALAKTADLRPGQTVLEIGCGWGGFAQFAAREVGAKVTAITLSPAQQDHARRRIFEEGLADRVDIRLLDYRDVEGAFDRVVSIEMFEAVGEAYWSTYFAKLRDLLKPGGRAGLQIITLREDLFEGYRARPDFIQMHVFPGGMLPTEERLLAVTARAGLDGQVARRFGQDYARTLHDWRLMFESEWPAISRMGFDARFHRLWRYYLAYCEAGFRTARTDVVHLGLKV